MKKLLAIVLALALCVGLCACGGEPATEGGKTEDPKPTYEPVTIGDCTVAFDGAETYRCFEKDYLLFYYTFTNNSDETVKAASKVFVPAKLNGETVEGIAFLKDQQPEFYNNQYKEVAPGETIRCMEPLQGLAEGGGEYEITVMDLYHQIEEKLVVTFNSKDLPIIIEK